MIVFTRLEVDVGSSSIVGESDMTIGSLLLLPGPGVARNKLCS